MKPARILLIFATQAEADPLLAAMGDVVTREGDTTHLHSDGHATRLRVTGMGPAAAAHIVRAELARERPAVVINAGIAGALHSGFGLGEVVEVEAAAHAMPGDTENLAFMALPALRPAGWPKDLRRGRLITRPTPLFDVVEATRLATRADLVDMEGAAIVQACADADVPCVLLKAVSDFADDRATLLSNLARASQALAQVLQTTLRPSSLSGVMP